MAQVNAAGNPTTSGKRAAGTVLLQNPIQGFSIPTVNAECVMDDTVDAVTYLPPEEIDIIDYHTGETVQTCRVPVMEDKKLIGYMPLPKRYHAVWLELSYNIVIYSNMWRLWAEEENKEGQEEALKQKARLLRRTTGTQVAQHKLARLLCVLELVSWSHETETSGKERVLILDEWKIRSTRDWFHIPYDKVPRKDYKFLNADPIRPENQALFETSWNVDKQGKGLLTPPEDLAEWFDGEVDGLEEMFEAILKQQALTALALEDAYFQNQHDPKAKLPERWHEGQEPRPCFWSVKLWNWVAQGNDLWDKPIDLFYYVLKEDPPYTDVKEFIRDLDALFTIVDGEHEVQQVHDLAEQLWLGEMTWREFVDALIENHLPGPESVPTTSEKKDPNNVFDTFEARLVLEGYVRRHDLNPEEPWNLQDNVLWSALARVVDKNYKNGWSWIISEVVSGKKVTETLKAAGPWWNKYRAEKKAKKVAHARALEEERLRALEKDKGGAGTSGPSETDADTQEANDANMEEPDRHAEKVSGGTDDAGNEEGDPMQSSDKQAERKRQADKMPAVSSSETPAQVGASVGEKERLTPEETTAMNQMLDYIKDPSLDKYEAGMKSYFSQEHAGSIEEYIQALRALGPLTGPEAVNALKTPFDEFLHRVGAIEARKESARSRVLL